MTGNSKYPYNTCVDEYYESCRNRILISGRGCVDNNAQVSCAVQNKRSALELRPKLWRKEDGWGEFLSVKSSKYDPEF
jgi:hypothetical protein